MCVYFVFVFYRLLIPDSGIVVLWAYPKDGG